MLRHGESVWNADNKFCGWYDADLADSGIEEAKKAVQVCWILCMISGLNFRMMFFRHFIIALVCRLFPI